MAANILWTAFGLLWRSFNGLMDHALPEDEQRAVRQAIEAHLQPGMHFHALRTRQAGAGDSSIFICSCRGEWTVQAAHDLTEQIEAAIRAVLPGGAEVVVHVEPVEAQAAWQDSALLAVEPPRPGT